MDDDNLGRWSNGEMGSLVLVLIGIILVGIFFYTTSNDVSAEEVCLEPERYQCFYLQKAMNSCIDKVLPVFEANNCTIMNITSF